MPMKSRFVRRAAVLTALCAGAALQAAACPVCYGAADSPSTQGMTAAIFSLLGVTGGVLAGFGTMFLRFRRRSRELTPAGGRAGEFETTTGKETDVHG